MKCEASKKLIYLYNELSEPERQQLERHVGACESCRRLLEESQNDRHVLKELMTPVVDGNEELTNRIMNEVIALNRNKATLSPPLIDRRVFRLGLALASLLLLVGFGIEFNRTTDVRTHEIVAGHGKIMLNSSLFYNPSLRDSIDRPRSLLSLADCIKACSDYDQWKVCADCKSKIKITEL